MEPSDTNLDLIFKHANCSSGCIKIEYVETFKYLGLTMDSGMLWKPHIDILQKYMIAVLQKIYIIRLVCPVSVLTVIYLALVESRVSYGLVCWGGTYDSRL